MVLRLPGSRSDTRQTGLETLDYELAGEMAASLGRAGRHAEEALTRLRACGDDPVQREDLLRSAALAVHAWFIQRELCGMRRHDAVIRDHAIPKAVLARLGAR